VEVGATESKSKPRDMGDNFDLIASTKTSGNNRCNKNRRCIDRLVVCKIPQTLFHNSPVHIMLGIC